MIYISHIRRIASHRSHGYVNASEGIRNGIGRNDSYNPEEVKPQLLWKPKIPVAPFINMD